MKKNELRKIFRAKRLAVGAAEISAASRKIAELFFKNIPLENAKVLHTFIRIRRLNEIDTSLIYYRIWRDYPKIKTAAPSTDLTAYDVINLQFHSGTELVENEWGIREPGDGPPIAPGELDVVLVPLLCFDQYGHRVGYGKGIYDRLLANCRPDCQRIGLSLFDPVEAIDDATKSDISLNACLTPNAVYSFGQY